MIRYKLDRERFRVFWDNPPISVELFHLIYNMVLKAHLVDSMDFLGSGNRW